MAEGFTTLMLLPMTRRETGTSSGEGRDTGTVDKVGSPLTSRVSLFH